MKQKLPIGIQSFPELIRGDYLYIDKTEYIYRLITSGKYYFLSRPRRFGKSLLLSTLEEVFGNNRPLFKGLWIEDKLDQIQAGPVIKLSFARASQGEAGLEADIHQKLDQLAVEFGVKYSVQDYPAKFDQLIQEVGRERQVAILVDEYDKPIINYILEEEKAEANREVLKKLYSVIKDNDPYIRFFLLTGVSRFSQVSIFSDLNNLDDITFDRNYSSMLGYTEAELIGNFPEQIAELQAEHLDLFQDILPEIKKWYNGYSWDGLNFVYNPFSILNLFSKREFENYWYHTGTPTFLIRLIRQTNYPVSELSNLKVPSTVFYNLNVQKLEISSLLFQTGYLTIKNRERISNIVTLDFPNYEVESSFSLHLLSELAERERDQAGKLAWQIGDSLRERNYDRFITLLRALFANVPFPVHPDQGSNIQEKERYYHSIFTLTLFLLGYNIESEILTHDGRIDAVVQLPDLIYILEFKLGDARSALNQIREKRYHLKFTHLHKKIVLMGIGFDVLGRNIGDYEAEEIEIG